jgi:stage V sporulation protein G
MSEGYGLHEERRSDYRGMVTRSKGCSVLPDNQTESGAELVTFTVANARTVDSKSLFALVDVEMQIAGVTFEIRGVQARRIANGGTSVELPTFKDGPTWRAAIGLPEELRGPLADAVLQFLVDEGLARPRFTTAAA